jgi:hypothetical protein
MNLLKDYSITLFLAGFLWLLSRELETIALVEFLKSNLLMILVGLFAINATTNTLTLSKIRDLQEKGNDFTRTLGSVKMSITEQLALIIVSTITVVCYGSEILTRFFSYLDFVLLATFVHALRVLYDTSMATLMLLKK